MDEAELLRLAKAAFDAIEKSTGIAYWNESDGLSEAIMAFDEVVAELGLAGMIDAASDSGMAHLGWSYWMTTAKELCGAK